MASTVTNSESAPEIITALPGPLAAAWVARDDQVLSPSYTRDYPLVVARGSGATIEDVDGNVFLDFTAGLAVSSTGHAHPDVVAAIADQASRLIHMSGTDFYYAAEIELAERLARIAPGDSPKRVFFANSGAETVEAALKLARYHTRRSQVIAFYGAFHGRTYGAMSLGSSKAVHRGGFEPLVPGVHRLEYDCTRNAVESLFARAVRPEDVAAIFVEPVLGEGGYRVPQPEFLPMLRDVCDAHGILLVADEVQTGMGRTGRMFAVEHFGVEPDLMCLAKGIASGMPLGALVARAEIMDWPAGSHGSTFGGNPVSCRAALATIDLIERQYLANAGERGQQLKRGLVCLERKSACLENVRGLGLMLAVDVIHRGQADPERRNALVRAAFEAGLLVVGCGSSSIRFCPPLCVTADQIDRGLEVFGEAASS